MQAWSRCPSPPSPSKHSLCCSLCLPSSTHFRNAFSCLCALQHTLHLPLQPRCTLLTPVDHLHLGLPLQAVVPTFAYVIAAELTWSVRVYTDKDRKGSSKRWKGEFESDQPGFFSVVDLAKVRDLLVGKRLWVIRLLQRLVVFPALDLA